MTLLFFYNFLMTQIMLLKSFLLFVVLTLLSGCGGETRQITREEQIYSPRDRERIGQMKMGKGLLADLFKVGKGGEAESREVGNMIGTSNNPLWKASLDVLSTFPISSVDSKSGIIITDWYSSEKKPSERFKITVLILSKEITSSAVQVKIHKQYIKNSRWINANLNNEKNLAIERKIIQRAVEFRSKAS